MTHLRTVETAQGFEHLPTCDKTFRFDLDETDLTSVCVEVQTEDDATAPAYILCLLYLYIRLREKKFEFDC